MICQFNKDYFKLEVSKKKKMSRFNNLIYIYCHSITGNIRLQLTIFNICSLDKMKCIQKRRKKNGPNLHPPTPPPPLQALLQCLEYQTTKLAGKSDSQVVEVFCIGLSWAWFASVCDESQNVHTLVTALYCLWISLPGRHCLICLSINKRGQKLCVTHFCPTL